MANNYSSGTLQTNFDEAQSAVFQRQAYAWAADQMGDASGLEEGLALYDAESKEYCPDRFDSEPGGNFWDMENFDVDAAEWGIQAVFDAFPNSNLTAYMRVAFYCDKPRMGEFGGYAQDFLQGITK